MALRGSVGTGPLAKAGQPHPWTSQIFPEWKQGSNPVCSVGLQSTAGHPGPTEKVGDPGQQPGRGWRRVLHCFQVASPPS